MANSQYRHRSFIRRWFPLQGIIVLVIGILLTGLHAPHASAQPAERENVTLEGSHADAQFLAGRSVRISAQVADDVFAAGRYVTFDGASVGNAIVAGQDVAQRGGSAADMIAMAANLTIAGAIEDDLVAGARSMRLSSGGTVGGDVRLAADTIELEGRVGGSVRAVARRVTISGEVSGKVDLLAERIVIAPGANISGDLIYRSGAEPEVAEGATISGDIRRVEIAMPELRDFAAAVLGIGIFLIVSWAIAMLVLIVILQLALPNFMSDAAKRLHAHPWSHLGRGIVALLAAGIVAALLFVSVIGIPIGGTLLVVTGLVWLLGLVTVSMCIGLSISGRLRGGAAPAGRSGRIGWTLLGAVILGLICLVPIVGGLVSGLAVAAGFSAAGAEAWTRLRRS